MKRKYPWEKWMARGHTFRLMRGKDFDSAPHSMSVQIRQAAINRGKKASVMIEGETLIVTISPSVVLYTGGDNA